ncbi:MAG TPA: hypothetical protein VHF91_05580 [Acidimicrobiales bacterium]|nr:hypothetical protein [Acidimicrobiales bacterium]
MQSQIELARRTEHLVDQRGQNERRRATEEVLASRIEAEGQAERRRLLADAQADATRAVGMAEADAETARLVAYQALDAATIVGLALKELAANLPQIGTVTLTPDLLTPIARLGAGRDGA